MNYAVFHDGFVATNRHSKESSEIFKGESGRITYMLLQNSAQLMGELSKTFIFRFLGKYSSAEAHSIPKQPINKADPVGG